ncbi:MAG: hypothetical protein NTV97_00665, partial [Alphaproteobacteria bacterium]|nr:hypothetical protein [Alphaproteobacteria bacterium]
MEAPHHIDQQRQHEQRDQDDDHQQEIVQPGDVAHQRRVGGRETHLPIVRHAEDLLRPGARGEHQSRDRQQNA